jgi:predicted enzyme related to lactoylglutathione lyase
MANSVSWFEVAGKDHAGLKTFYSGLFDWRLNDMDGMPYSILENADGGIPGGIGGVPEGSNGHVTFYVAVDDLEASLGKAESLGGKRAMDPTDIPGGQIAQFTDPEGHLVGLMHMDG